MNEAWTDSWNERYSSDAFAYGEEPNNFLRDKLQQLPAGKILFAAEGEGRNAVYAASIGWNVWAFDISIEGKNKAQLLAEKKNTKIDYQVGLLENLDYKVEQFDAIALIYAHFPAAIKSDLHKQLSKLLCKNGILIFEAFSKNHLAYIAKNKKVGGPKDVDMLFSIDELKTDFAGYEIMQLEEKEIELNEGIYHNGTGSVIRFVGRNL